MKRAIFLMLFFFVVFGFVLLTKESPWVPIIWFLLGGLMIHIYRECEVKNLESRLRIVSEERDTAVQAANTDPLTGLFNRRGAKKEAERLLKIQNRRGFAPRVADSTATPTVTPTNHQSVAVAYLDLDNFKGANDTLGHQAGDLIIQLAAELLRRSFARPTDIVCRRGGDEFVVILTEDAEAVVGQLEKFQRVFVAELRQLLNPNSQEDDPRIAVTVSCGVQVRPLLLSTDFANTESFLETMFKQADALLYQAKQLGKNRIALDIN